MFPHEQRTVAVTYSGWIPCFISSPFVRSRVRESKVFHQAFHVPVEGEVVASELSPIAVLLDGHHIEGGPRRVSLILHSDGLPPVRDGLLELGHDRIVSPPSHNDSSVRRGFGDLPQNRVGRSNAVESTPPDRILPDAGAARL